MGPEVDEMDRSERPRVAAVWNGVRVVIAQGDITRQDTDAIVNAANTALAPGSGVDGAIQAAAGPELLREREEARRRLGGSLATGSAVATGAGRLMARRIIHTAGPIWGGGGHGEAELLRSSYRASLRVAKEEGLASVAFPAISAGIYGYPLAGAAREALGAVRAELQESPGSLREIRFVLFNARTMEEFERALREVDAVERLDDSSDR